MIETGNLRQSFKNMIICKPLQIFKEEGHRNNKLKSCDKKQERLRKIISKELTVFNRNKR